MRARVAVSLVCAALLCAGCTETKPAPPANAIGAAADTPTVALSVAACEPGGWCVGAGADPSSSTVTTALEVSHGGHERWVRAAIPQLGATTFGTAACWASGCLLGGASPAGAVMVLVDPTHRDASEVAAPPGASVGALACPGPGQCLALVDTSTASSLYVTTSSGSSWTLRGTLPSALSSASALACSTPSVCVAAGAGTRGAAIAVTGDGGARWQLEALPAVLAVVTSVACSTGLGCLATSRQHDGAAALLVRRGASWQLSDSPIQGAAAVACSTGTCVLGGGDGTGALAATTNGTSWRLLTLDYVPSPVVALGCATALRCAGVTATSTVSIAP